MTAARPFDSDIIRLLEASPDTARYAVAFFQDGRSCAERAIAMSSFDFGAQFLLVKMRGQGKKTLEDAEKAEMANEALVLALFAELQDLAAQLGDLEAKHKTLAGQVPA